MSVEKLHVLEMLSAGKLTIEEADALLAALDTAGDPAPPAARADDAADWPAPFTEAAARGAAPQQAGRLTLDQVAALRNAGVNGEYIGEMREAVGRSLTFDELIALRNAGVKPDWVEEMRENGLPELTVTQIVALRNAGVRPDYLEGLIDGGLSALTYDQVIDLHNAGVRADTAEGFHAAGLNHELTVAQLIALHNAGYSRTRSRLSARRTSSISRLPT